MGALSAPPGVPPPSALHSLLGTHTLPQDSQYPLHLHQLALQVAHNLRFQHNWTDVRIHYASRRKDAELKKLPRPVISGVPQQRLYIHPDEQIELLQRQKDQGKTGMPELAREREWVLPSHLREKWTLRTFGEVFDAVSTVPPKQDGEALFSEEDDSLQYNEFPAGDEEAENNSIEAEDDAGESNHWRMSQPKRLLLATLDDDSTVVYYIVHDGIVKPRQN